MEGRKKKIILCFILTLCLSLTGCIFVKKTYSEQLYQAILHQDQEEFERLLHQRGDLNTPRTKHATGIFGRLNDFENVYPLEIACKKSPKMARELLEAGADPNVTDEYLHSSPLIYALETNHDDRFSLAMELIRRGADINHVDDNKRTALNACVEVLDTDSDKAKEDSMVLLQYLLENCDIPEVTKQSFNDPLSTAASYNNTDAILYMLENNYFNVNIATDGYTPLMRAVLAENVEATQLLLDMGADKNIISPNKKSAYDYAKEKNNKELMRLLDASTSFFSY